MSSPGDRVLLLPLAACLVLVVAACLGPSPLTAQATSEAESRKDLKNWQIRMDKADQLLLAGEYRKARREIDDLIGAMIDGVVKGDPSKLFALASLQRAIAEAGLGNEHAAFWDLDVARAFDEGIAGLDLAAYGKPAELLSRSRDTLEDEARTLDLDAMGRPVPLERPAPHYPRNLRLACIEASITLRLILDENGRLREPSFGPDEHPVFVFSALQSLRDWSYEPATVDGEPVFMFYNITQNFDVGGCGD